MYDFPELREATDTFWTVFANRLSAAGLKDVPHHLTRHLSTRAVCSHPALLFAQACQYPLAKSFSEHVRVAATPCYSAPGCDGANYRSAIIVRAEETGGSLEDLRGQRCVINEVDSNSGMNLLRAAVAPFARQGRFFQSVALSGSHLRSVQMVACGEGDLAAIDCVSFEHFRRLYPQLVGRVRVLGWTDSSPALPFITGRSTGAAALQTLRSVLAEMCNDGALAAVRESLLLCGVDLQPAEGFREVLHLERQAIEQGYPAIDGLQS
jgi:ABC-type phosphate/phosphonate transport system substrate-binding protein